MNTTDAADEGEGGRGRGRGRGRGGGGGEGGAREGAGKGGQRGERAGRDGGGNQRGDGDGYVLWDDARGDRRVEGGAEEPTTYGDVVVSQARADSWARRGAAADGAVAAEAVARKVRRYPPEQVPGAKLVALSVEAGGRQGKDAKDFLWRAAGRATACNRRSAELGGPGRAAACSIGLCQLTSDQHKQPRDYPTTAR